jgi:hypothetical protein
MLSEYWLKVGAVDSNHEQVVETGMLPLDTIHGQPVVMIGNMILDGSSLYGRCLRYSYLLLFVGCHNVRPKISMVNHYVGTSHWL